MFTAITKSLHFSLSRDSSLYSWTPILYRFCFHYILPSFSRSSSRSFYRRIPLQDYFIYIVLTTLPHVAKPLDPLSKLTTDAFPFLLAALCCTFSSMFLFQYHNNILAHILLSIFFLKSSEFYLHIVCKVVHTSHPYVSVDLIITMYNLASFFFGKYFLL